MGEQLDPEALARERNSSMIGCGFVVVALIVAVTAYGGMENKRMSQFPTTTPAATAGGNSENNSPAFTETRPDCSNSNWVTYVNSTVVISDPQGHQSTPGLNREQFDDLLRSRYGCDSHSYTDPNNGVTIIWYPYDPANDLYAIGR